MNYKKVLIPDSMIDDIKEILKEHKFEYKSITFTKIIEVKNE